MSSGNQVACADVSSHDREVTDFQVGSCEVSSISLYAALICSTEINKAGESPCVDLIATNFVVLLEFVLAV